MSIFGREALRHKLLVAEAANTRLESDLKWVEGKHREMRDHCRGVDKEVSDLNKARERDCKSYAIDLKRQAEDVNYLADKAADLENQVVFLSAQRDRKDLQSIAKEDAVIELNRNAAIAQGALDATRDDYKDACKDRVKLTKDLDSCRKQHLRRSKIGNDRYAEYVKLAE